MAPFYGAPPALRDRWAVATTQPHRESIAIENLERQHFTCYCPRLSRSIRHARKRSDVLRPLFPGYVFVRVNPECDRWRPIESTTGVRTLVRFGERIGLVDDAFITSLRAREVDGRIVLPATSHRLGDKVRVIGGPMDGIVAEIVQMTDRQRLVVLMTLMNQSVRVSVEAARVSPA